MSRFKGTYRPPSAPAAAATAVATPLVMPWTPAPSPPDANPLKGAQAPEPRPGLAHKLGFFFLATYLLAGVINGAVSRLTGNTTYLTAVCLAAIPVLMLMDGTVLSSINKGIGKTWLLFAAWLILGVFTSVWQGGSVRLLIGYIPRSLMVYFFITSFVATVKENRRLMYLNIFATFLLVLNCAAFGSMKSGRLEIPKSLFFENANDLGLSLLLGIFQTAFLFYMPGIRAKVIGGLVALSSLFFMLKTGSRGCFAALLLAGCVAFFFSRQKVIFAGLGFFGLLVALVVTPADLRSRLTFIVSEQNVVFSEGELASYGSQLQREQLLKQSLALTLQHPIFGVGPGEFAVAVYEDARRENRGSNWLGTHNSYTEISSECGIPALILYLSIIIWTLRTSWKIHRGAVGRRGMHAVAGLSCSLFLGTVAFASGTFFFHVAYTGFLPILSGSVAALRSAVENKSATPLAAAA